MAEKNQQNTRQLKFSSKSTADDVAGTVDLSGKVAIVTGANTGIGLVTARVLAKIGAHVIIACRDTAKGQAALDTIKQATGSDKVELMPLDLGSFASIRAFVKRFNKKKLPLHYLINNAGTYAPKETRTVDGFEAHLGINHLGPFLLTYLLIDKLKASAPSRIINVSAHSHKMVSSIDWNTVNSDKSAFSAVGISKIFGVWHAAELHSRLFKFGVSAFSLHPGLVKTDVFRDSWLLGLVAWIGGQTPETGAATTIFTALHADPASQGGEYFADCAVSSKTKFSADQSAAKKAWDESVKMCGLDATKVEATLEAPAPK